MNRMKVKLGLHLHARRFAPFTNSATAFEPPAQGKGCPSTRRARHCGVSIGMLFKLENGKGVNLEHALRVMDGLGLTMLVVPKAHAPWLEQAAAHAAQIGEDAAREQHAWLGQ